MIHEATAAWTHSLKPSRFSTAARARPAEPTPGEDQNGGLDQGNVNLLATGPVFDFMDPGDHSGYPVT